MKNNGLPVDVTQADYDNYVKDMESFGPDMPDEATIDDMEREHISLSQMYAVQKKIFSHEHIDAILMNDRGVYGKGVHSSMYSIADAAGVLSVDKRSMFGSMAQQAMSYYALQRLDDAGRLDVTAKDYLDVSFNILRNLGTDKAYVDGIINGGRNQSDRTSIFNEGVNRIFDEVAPGYTSFSSSEGVCYPSNMRSLFGDGPWRDSKTMPEYVLDMIKTNKRFDELPAYKAALQDRFCNMLPGALDDDADKRAFFDEIANACDAIQAPVAGSLGVVIERNEPESVTRALLGYSASKSLHNIGFGEYMAQRGLDKASDVAIVGREIKNAPDFVKDDGPERSDGYEY